MSRHTPYLWLQDDEEDAIADCGCVLEATRGGSGAAITFCDVHAAAFQLRDMVQRLTTSVADLRTADMDANGLLLTLQKIV